ncbi:hypothetical protein VCR6J2_230269 [Vibrio coralliirubri]|nr:hypothetical protein VCR6J2_230269 [Vibrio coralliirubri]CDT14492.1 hypothetical protein VCR1J2_200650 [Vibrio coralliirubri]
MKKFETAISWKNRSTEILDGFSEFSFIFEIYNVPRILILDFPKLTFVQ